MHPLVQSCKTDVHAALCVCVQGFACTKNIVHAAHGHLHLCTHHLMHAAAYDLGHGCIQASTTVAVRTALLLHGTPGSGKATAVRAAAAALGLHTIPYGCAGLHGGDRQTAPLLRAAYEAAESFAPAVLLLTGFEAVAGSAAEAASNPGWRCCFYSNMLAEVDARHGGRLLPEAHWFIGCLDDTFSPFATLLQACGPSLMCILSIDTAG